MLASSKAKQLINKQASLDLLTLVNRFAEIFWETKQIDTYRADCPYPPGKQLIYPRLISG
jgi:nickel superoxide dismutase